MVTANIRFDVLFEKPHTVLRPLCGTIAIKCGCGYREWRTEAVTLHSEMACFTCPVCGVHFCVEMIRKFRDECFERFKRNLLESN